jgi:SecD/SecF fusion protein
MTIYPLMKYRYYYIAVLGAVTLISFIAVFVVGLRLGIEFEGGVRAEVVLETPATTNDVRQVAVDAGAQGAVVQSVGENSFVITAEQLSDEQFEAVVADLGERYGAEAAAAGIERVGPSFGQETADKALIAIAASILAIIVYITWRFEFKFAIPAIVALVHDIGLTLAVYALTDRLVTTATVAAVLTVLGYSLNDTIIVFDRIRENTPPLRRETYGDMVDRSIRQVLFRSLNTAITTLLPVTAILLFGGPTLKDFAFALFIGIASGAYSSIFVASPLLTVWKEREPRYRKRLVSESAG